MHTVSTLLFVRLFVEREGPGKLMASVPLGLGELAQRVRAGEDDLFGMRISEERLVRRGKRLVFRLDPDLWPVQEDVRSVSAALLSRERVALGEVLSRVAHSGWETRPLLREELAYLQSCVDAGSWESGITVMDRP